MPDTSTKDVVEAFLRAKEAKGLSPYTLQTYRYRLGILSAAVPTLAAGLDGTRALEAFLLTVGPSPDTRAAYYRLLRNLYGWLVARGEIEPDSNPMSRVEAPRVPRKIARALTPDELRQLFLYSHRRVDRAFLLLLADTGLRLAEALSVGRGSFGAGAVVVTGKVGQREVPISAMVEHEVQSVLPWPWRTPGVAGRAVQRAFSRAGIEGRRASAHALRHTFVRLWRGDESLLVSLMGWSSPQMLRIYRPYDRQRAAEQHRRYSPLRLAEIQPGPYQGRLL